MQKQHLVEQTRVERVEQAHVVSAPIAVVRIC
jgi:hypothetical protein